MGVQSVIVGLATLAHGVVGFRASSNRVMAGVHVRNRVHVRNFRSDAPDWTVMFKQGTTDADIKGFCQGGCDLEGHPDAKGVPFAKVHGLEQLSDLVVNHPEKIELVEPDEIDYALDESVEMASASWGLDAVGTRQRSGSGRGVHIYVQDTGIRGSHTDFGGRVVPTIDLTSGRLVECSSSSCAGDRQGHGTHCAGTAGGRTYGVASEATLHAVKTLSDQGSGARSWQMAAIDWITVNGARPAVISMSLGGRGADPAYTTSIGAATVAGVVVVVAAGNSNSDSCNFSPAFAADAITVGATTSSNSRASYSNYGTCNDIFAPGSAIRSASSSSNTGSRSLSGTSMACPHVSGAAAILLEQKPTLGRNGVMASLEANALRGHISGLRTNDPDLFLWLGAPSA